MTEVIRFGPFPLRFEYSALPPPEKAGDTRHGTRVRVPTVLLDVMIDPPRAPTAAERKKVEAYMAKTNLSPLREASSRRLDQLAWQWLDDRGLGVRDYPRAVEVVLRAHPELGDMRAGDLSPQGIEQALKAPPVEKQPDPTEMWRPPLTEEQRREALQKFVDEGQVTQEQMDRAMSRAKKGQP